MQRSSETIGAIAAALAKAQIELTNPEKSLTATIVSPFPREENKTFRYASLSSGLEIVRKCLGKHEIAAVQTTAIDKDTGLIRLTTTLAHASGEWVASDWPVCPVSETCAPHRLGAALTYARRHSLFTLVGIAGDDDRDAPNLATQAPQSVNGALGTEGAQRNAATRPPPSTATVSSAAVVKPQSETPSRNSFMTTRSSGQGQRCPPSNRPTMLTAEASALERERLLGSLNQGQNSDALAVWAQTALPVKNTLTAPDAQALESAFARRVEELGSPRDQTPKEQANEAPIPGAIATPSHSCDATVNAQGQDAAHLEQTLIAVPTGAMVAPEVGQRMDSSHHRKRRRTSGCGQPDVHPKIDKSVLAFPEPKRIRDKEHLKFVGRQPCLICGRVPSDAHHLRFAQLRALGRKVSDEFTVPLCRGHHREAHRTGNELTFWKGVDIDALQIAQHLWKQSPGQVSSIVEAPTIAIGT